MGEETSTGLIKGVEFGVAKPGETIRQTLHLLTMGAAGERVVDISIQSRAIGVGATDTPELFADTNETLRTLIIPTVPSLHTSVDVTYQRLSGPLPSLLDFKLFEPDGFATEHKAVVSLHLSNRGPCDLSIQAVKFVSKVRQYHNKCLIN